MENNHIDNLKRFESIGDNCEFGFVLRGLGFDEGGLFKWARLDIHALTKVLAADLEHIFDFENLSPLRLSMVLEGRYGIGWHSSITCHFVDGQLQFVDPEHLRREKHRSEARKFDYLKAKFLAKLRAGGAIFVFKSNEGVASASVAALDNQLRRLANGAVYWLVVVAVAADPALIGTVRIAGATLIEGFVDRFADYNTADDFSAEVWRRLVDNVLWAAPYSGWMEAKSRADDEVKRRFKRLDLPFGGSRMDELVMDGEICVGSQSPNTWSRRLEDMFRLHAERDLSRPALLFWRGITLPSGTRHVLSITHQLSTDHSKTVDVEIRVRSGDLLFGMALVKSGRHQEVVELLIDSELRPLSIELYARRCFDLKDGEVAAVDIGPVELRTS